MSTETLTPKTSFLTFAALMALLVLTVAASYLPLGPFAVAAALLIAIAKAALIIFVFMEVRTGHSLVRLFAFAGFLWLLLFLILVMCDYATR